MNLRDPESMSAVIGNVLRYGVLVSAAVTLFGTFLMATASGSSDSAAILTYYPDQVPHGNFPVSFQALISGLVSLSPFAWIELGVIFLIATPVSRVLISVLLFAAEKDRLYVVITAVVLVLLLFSMLVTPLIPLFHAQVGSQQVAMPAQTYVAVPPACHGLTIHTVFFDLGGTLLIMRRDRIISRILSDAGYPASPEQVHSAYFKVEPSWLAIYGERTMTGDETEEAYRQLDAMIFGLLFPGRTAEEVNRVSTLARQMWPEVEKTVPLQLYPDAVPTLSRLNSDGYTLGLVSNAPPDTVRVIDSLGLPRYLPVVVVSGVVGFSKPNPEIFRIALRQAGAKAEEAIHIGDLYEADVVGARNAGMSGVLIDRDGTRDGLDCPIIRGLDEVYGLLE